MEYRDALREWQAEQNAPAPVPSASPVMQPSSVPQPLPPQIPTQTQMTQPPPTRELLPPAPITPPPSPQPLQPAELNMRGLVDAREPTPNPQLLPPTRQVGLPQGFGGAVSSPIQPMQGGNSLIPIGPSRGTISAEAGNRGVLPPPPLMTVPPQLSPLPPPQEMAAIMPPQPPVAPSPLMSPQVVGRPTEPPPPVMQPPAQFDPSAVQSFTELPHYSGPTNPASLVGMETLNSGQGPAPTPAAQPFIRDEEGRDPPAPAPASNFSKIWEDAGNPMINEGPQYGDAAPKRSDFGTSDEGGHMEYRSALREWREAQDITSDPLTGSVQTTNNNSDFLLPESRNPDFATQTTPVGPDQMEGTSPNAVPFSQPIAPPQGNFTPQGRRYIQAPQEPQSMPYYDPYQGRTPGFGLPGTGMFAPTTPFGVRGIGNVMGTGRYGMPPPMYYPMQQQMGYGSPFGMQSASPMGGKGGPAPVFAPPPPPPRPFFGGNRGFGGKAGRGRAPSPPPPPRPSFGRSSGKAGRSPSPSYGGGNPWGSGGARSAFKQGGLFSSPFEGLVPGSGGGMDDVIPASIEGQEPILVSRDEYILPADAVSDIGDGSTGRGAEILDNMVSGIRLAKNGSPAQPRSMMDISGSA